MYMYNVTKSARWCTTQVICSSKRLEKLKKDCWSVTVFLLWKEFRRISWDRQKNLMQCHNISSDKCFLNGNLSVDNEIYTCKIRKYHVKTKLIFYSLIWKLANSSMDFENAKTFASFFFKWLVRNLHILGSVVLKLLMMLVLSGSEYHEILWHFSGICFVSSRSKTGHSHNKVH